MTLVTTHSQPVVLGLDGTESSVRALYWALTHLPTDTVIQPVMSWVYPTWAYATPYGSMADLIPGEVYEGQARAVINKTLEKVEPSRYLEPLIVHGNAGPSLVSAAASAGLLIIGCRDRSASAAKVLGSVSSYCAAHSEVPTIVVPSTRTETSSEPLAVAAVDGSKNAQEALRWALDHLHPDVALQVFHASGQRNARIPGRRDLSDTDRAKAESEVDGWVADAQAASSADGRNVSTLITSGDPRSLLRELSTDLLIVGARGHQGVPHLVLGSVTTALLHRPVVPTAVIPAR